MYILEHNKLKMTMQVKCVFNILVQAFQTFKGLRHVFLVFVEEEAYSPFPKCRPLRRPHHLKGLGLRGPPHLHRFLCFRFPVGGGEEGMTSSACLLDPHLTTHQRSNPIDSFILCNCQKSSLTITLTSCNFCNSTPNVKLKSAQFTRHTSC